MSDHQKKNSTKKCHSKEQKKCHKKDKCKDKCKPPKPDNGETVIYHDMEFILNDFDQNPVFGTEFKVKLKIIKSENNKIRIYFPTTNFYVGQASIQSFGSVSPISVPASGTLRTSSGFLPLDLCPNSAVYQSSMAPSNTPVIQPQYFSNLYFTGSMQPSVYQGFIQNTTFSAYIDPLGLIMYVDPTSITGPLGALGLGLFPGCQVINPSIPATILAPGTTIVEVGTNGPNSYRLSGITGPIGTAPSGYVTGFYTQSILQIDSITSGAPPLIGVTITASGVSPNPTVTNEFLAFGSNGTGLYFVSGNPNQSSTPLGMDTTITANQPNVLNVTQSIAGSLITPGMVLYGPGVTTGTVISAYTTNSNGGTGSYIVNIAQTFPTTQINVYTFLNSMFTTPTIPGYMINIGPFGDILIQGPGGSIDSQIPGGPQTLMATTIDYIAEPHTKLKHNKKLSTGTINVTQWVPSQYGGAGSALRDGQDNDAYDNVLTWAWADNSKQTDQSNGVSDAVVVIGKIVDEKIVARSPFQLSNNGGTYNDTMYPYLLNVISPPLTTLPTFIFGTATAINRVNPKNIIVSWALGNVPTFPFRAVSFDGGNTWPYNGPANIQASGGAGGGDNRGVQSDKYGNIWYLVSNFNTQLVPSTAQEQLVWLVSPDGGITFYTAYSTPPNVYANDGGNDSPTYCFGYDGYGNYGFWYGADYDIEYGNTTVGFNEVPITGFVPITGPMSKTTTATFTATITGTTLNIVSGSIVGTVSVGQTIGGNNFNPAIYLDPTTQIVSGSGLTWNIPQTISTPIVMYASVLPIGPLPQLQVAIAETTVTPTPVVIVANGLFILPVASTSGFNTPSGTLIITNTQTNKNCTVTYTGVTATTFTGCLCGTAFTVSSNNQVIQYAPLITSVTPTTVTLLPNVRFDLNVASTLGIAAIDGSNIVFSTIGTILVTDITTNRSVVVSYGGTTPTSFTGCLCGDGIGLGMTIGASDDTIITQLSTPSLLLGIPNQQETAAMTASQDPTDGRLWVASSNAFFAQYWFSGYGLRFKSAPNIYYPDIVQANYAGSWQIMSQVFYYINTGSGTISFENFQYFNPRKTIVYDDARQALYVIVNNRIHVDPYAVPDFTQNPVPPPTNSSQNMTLSFMISRDNGMNWSDPIYVSTTNFANRGFQSIALDTKKGNLLFGWYDGRNTSPNSPTAFQTLEYYSAVIPSKKLTKLVNQIPLSNPRFALGPVVENNSAATLSGGQNTAGTSKLSRKALPSKLSRKALRRQ